jgi:hypothetical protein
LKQDTRRLNYAAVRSSFLVPSRLCTPFLTPCGISPAEGIAVKRALCEENASTTFIFNVARISFDIDIFSLH